ncbi:Trafficking protein particle complex subunit 2-like protein [Hondaea fermentalgiana]|uniref:Trafficking protein particle complex subunit 2-like protein n=1 Tax=Hondaea fermentalgiana TaxID=2315210 RepID=A0A2R5GUH7_9STRA|nr:Trafficking protein particle complex subunit 2-like protein [Hondaea fermentalgiana]|eukprot:GBG33979.1 Trafficking protein particle complex subunit 2-like protein [Hondaea fermentalgiana]
MSAVARAAEGGSARMSGAGAPGRLGGAKTVAVAFVDGVNAPLFLKRFDDEAEKDSLDLLLVIHSALDAIDELRTNRRRGSRKSYLGLLNLVDGYAVFGHASNSLVKTMVVLDAEACGYAVPDDAVMEAYLSSLYNAYVDTVSNPFLELGSALQLGNEGDEKGAAMNEESPEGVLIGPPGRKTARHPELLQGFEELVESLVHDVQTAPSNTA